MILDELATARDALVKDRTAAKPSSPRGTPCGDASSHITQRACSHVVPALPADLREPVLRRMEVLTSIAGVGRVVAAGLLADMNSAASTARRRRA